MTRHAPDVSLPRNQAGAAPQRLLTVLLGDYWFGRQEPLASSAMVELLVTLDVPQRSARAAIQRLAQRGFLTAHRDGRRTSYAVHSGIQETLYEHVRQLFQAHHQQTWDGTWTIVTYRVPETSSPLRRTLREKLRQLRFGHLTDGVWIRPGRHAGLISSTLGQGSDLALDLVTCFEGAQLPASISPHELTHAFETDAIDDQYLSFARTWERHAKDHLLAPPSGTEALQTRTEVMSEWRALVRKDPQLPDEMLSENPPLRRAAKACAEIYDGLGAAAENVVRRVLERHQPELASLVTHHTFTDFEDLEIDAP